MDLQIRFEGLDSALRRMILYVVTMFDRWGFSGLSSFSTQEGNRDTPICAKEIIQELLLV